MLDVLHSERWTISSPGSGRESFERRFARAFAAFYGTKYAIPTSSGTAALTVAFKALGIGPGDEVLVPGLSWVACAAAVMHAGALPILVDVEEDSLCMSPGAAQSKIGPRTAAILIVHQNCSIADIPKFQSLAQARNLALIEDCSQAHGARWGGRHVGTFANVGAASLQQQKLLTCGEGGVVFTSDARLMTRLEQLRANGRVATSSVRANEMELEEVGDILGHNYVMSEFHAAIALDGLRRLPEEHATREANARLLTQLLSQIGGISPLCKGPGPSSLAYHKYTVRLSRQEFGSVDIHLAGKALSAELGFPVTPLDDPLNIHPLFAHCAENAIGPLSPVPGLDPADAYLPVATAARQECLVLRHHAFLGGDREMRDVATAFEKLKSRVDELHGLSAADLPVPQ